MSTDNQIATLDASILTQGEFEWHSTGEFSITYKAGTPQNVWLDNLKELSRLWDGNEKLTGRLRFIIGDALAFGEHAYGEEYAQAIELAAGALGRVKEKTIDNMMTVCRNVSPEVRRVDALTFAHHAAVQSLPPELQSELLTRAIAEGMSESGLRNAACRAGLSKGDLKLLKQQTEKEVDDLAASEIRKLLKRAKRGEPAKRTLIVDLNSEESLQLAADHILIFFKAHATEIDEWSSTRREAWRAIDDLAKIILPATGELVQAACEPLSIAAIAANIEASEDTLTDDQIDALAPLAKLWRRHRQNGVAKAKKGVHP